jgi:hypothetical protein
MRLCRTLEHLLEHLQMTPNAEYVEMKAFLRFFSERFLDQRIASPHDRPVAVLERQEQESPERASSGLRMAVNNCMEISSPWPLSQIVALDAEMQAKGIRSLSYVRSHSWGRYAAMLKRGVIRSADESAMAQAVLADQSLVQSLPEAERQSLQAMVSAYGRGRSNPSGEAARPGRPGRASHFRP